MDTHVASDCMEPKIPPKKISPRVMMVLMAVLRMRRSGLPVALSRALNAPLTPREYTAKARVARRGMAGAQLSPYMIRIISAAHTFMPAVQSALINDIFINTFWNLSQRAGLLSCRGARNGKIVSVIGAASMLSG